MSHPIEKLLALMSQLRDPKQGCPWDLKQNFASIAPHTLEEAYEVVDAIERSDFAELKGELGDLLFQVVFYSQLGKEEQLFDFNQIVETICEKLIRRHPHVFGDMTLESEQAIKANWEQEKAKERAGRHTQAHPPSVLDDLPRVLPALSRANKIQKRCAHVGFDWPDLPPVIAKVREELAEVEAELTAPVDESALTEELGDLLFAVVNMVRHLKRDPEQTLRRANDKFEQRFRMMEQQLLAEGRPLEECSLEEMDAAWEQAKLRQKR